MLNELFFHDGETGQVILPVLRPGNSQSNKWYVGLLKSIIIKIRKKYPKMKIIIRTDSGFSDASFYKLADEFNLFFAIGIASNNVLKQEVAELDKEVKDIYLSKKEKHQEFISFTYQANS